MKVNKETVKTWVIIALVFSIAGFVGGWNVHDHVSIDVHASQSK